MKVCPLFLVFLASSGPTTLYGSTHCEIIGKCKAQCDGTIINLSISDFASGNKSKESFFFLDPCQGYPCGDEGPETAVCRENHNGDLISCGLVNQTEWHLQTTDPFRYMLIFTEYDDQRTSSVTFIEDPSVYIFNSTYTGHDPSTGHYSFQVISRCVRPGICPIGTSEKPVGIIGFVFLTLFVAGTALYLFIGSFVMYCRGARRQELIPNVEFWKDLPQLIYEGCLFTVSPCLSCYQKKKPTVNYEELPYM